MFPRQRAPRNYGKGRNYTDNTHRSILLENFRLNRCPNLQLNDIVSHVVEFAKDRDGSKFIQRKLNDATEQRKETIFREIKPYLRNLMMDTFGNFVVQKFFCLATETQKLEIIQEIKLNFMLLSIHKYGCRVVQTIVINSSVEQQSEMLHAAFGHGFIRLVKDPNGNHVIQKCFQYVERWLQDMLFDQMIGQINALCKDLYGCRVMQFILINGTSNHRAKILQEILPNAMQLTRHRYGNYVIQHALQHCAPNDISCLFDEIVNQVILLSRQKYSSNVVEKCMHYAAPQLVETAFETILVQSPQNLKEFCLDRYANYVVQKFIKTGSLRLVTCLWAQIQPFFKDLLRSICGRKIIEMLQQRLTEN